MDKSRKRITAIILALIMVLGSLTFLGGGANAAAGDPVKVEIYDDSTFIGTILRTDEYASLYAAVNSLASGEYAIITTAATYRGDDMNVSVRNGGYVKISMATAVSLYAGGIVVDNDTTLELVNFNQNSAGTAINLQSGRLILGNRTQVIGASNGVVNNGGTTVFDGGKVSSYIVSSNGATIGTPSYIGTPPPTTEKVTGVSVTPRDFSMRIGSTVQLTPDVKPSTATNKNVNWLSGDSSIVTVTTSGLVSAKKAGSTWVRVRTEDGNYSEYSYVEVVTNAVNTTGIFVSPSSVSVAVGKTAQLTATVSPSTATNKAVSWVSNNANIVRVSSTGLITGRAKGSATVTATTADGRFASRSSVTVTATTTTYPASVSSDIAKTTKLYLEKGRVGGNIARSSTYVRIKPSKASATVFNSISLSVRAFDRLSEDRYSYLRYYLPWIYVDMFPGFTEDMPGSTTVDLNVRRLTSKTMSTRMYSAWRSYAVDNISGPWEIGSKSDEDDLVLRILLPKRITKSNLYLMYWNGSKFERVNSADYTVIVSAGSYYVRTEKIDPGVYAVVYR